MTSLNIVNGPAFRAVALVRIGTRKHCNDMWCVSAA